MNYAIYAKTVKKFKGKNSVLLNSLIISFDLFVLLLGINSSTSYLSVPLQVIGLTFFMLHSFFLMHEASHRLLVNNTKMNDYLGAILGGISLAPYESWRVNHMLHHKYAGNIDKDPVMKLVKGLKEKTIDVKFLNLIWKSWLPLMAIMQFGLFWANSFKKINLKRRRFNYLCSVTPIIFFAIILFANSIAYISVIVSIYFYFLAIEAVNFPHHLGVDYIEGEDTLPLMEQYKVTRTCTHSAFTSILLCLNFNYHTEHHLFPNVSWNNLKKLSSYLNNSSFMVDQNISNGFNWIKENRKLNIGEII